VADAVPEVTTVADDHAVIFWPADAETGQAATCKQYDGLEPDTPYEFDGVRFRTLPRPGGERLATVATVNDVHFGETVCGYESSMPEAGPTFSSLPGEPPYPEMMNGAAVEEITALDPDAVVVKGDLTADGLDEEYAAFLACYQGAFGDRLHHIRGNHDAYRGQTYAPAEPFAVTLPGVTLAVLDTTTPFSASGSLDADQLAWLDDLAAEADDGVLVFGHHHAWAPGSRNRPETYFGIRPDDSEAFVAVAARRPAIRGYFAGHTHRNRVRHFEDTGPMPWVEVACVKDFPGAWAEYRIFEGGILQVFHRIRRPDALDWSERTRRMFGGLYEAYAFGRLEDRCFEVPRRS
jgi:predicted phosphodiesterase